MVGSSPNGNSPPSSKTLKSIDIGRLARFLLSCDSGEGRVTVLKGIEMMVGENREIWVVSGLLLLGVMLTAVAFVIAAM